VILRENPGIEQITLARLLGLDRSTTAGVVALLERRQLIKRTVVDKDRRRRALSVTPEGLVLIEQGGSAMERARLRLLSPLDPQEQRAFLFALDKLLLAFNPVTRVPLLAPAVS